MLRTLLDYVGTCVDHVIETSRTLWTIFRGPF